MRIVENSATCQVCPAPIGLKGSKGLCRRHYVNTRNNPMLPAEPVLAEIERLSIPGDKIPEAVDRARETGFIHLYAADRFIVEVLNTHPAMLYGFDFFEPEFSWNPAAVLADAETRSERQAA